MTTPTDVTLQSKFVSLDAQLNSELQERSKEIHTAVTALIAGVHHCQIGPPGTSKSGLVRRLCERIDGMDDGGYFQWLLTKYTVPEEVFGPPLLTELKQGRYVRNTKRKLPVAKVAFLDEIFKGSSSILNSLLTIMNERLFFNEDENGDHSVPLWTVFGASNELPQSDELHALWDRLHFRHEIQTLKDGGSFVNMLSRPWEENPEPVLTWDEVGEAAKWAKQVTIPQEVFDALKTLRDNLFKEGVEPSERRFVESLKIIKAEAWREGRDYAEIDDMRSLQHVMWDRIENQKIVAKCVLELANPIDREAHDLLERVNGLDIELKRAIQDSDNAKALAKQAVEIHGKMHKTKARMDELAVRCVESGRKSEMLGELEKRFLTVAKTLMKSGFGIQDDNVKI